MSVHPSRLGNGLRLQECDAQIWIEYAAWELSVMHLSQGSTPKAMGTDPLQSYTLTGISENFVSAGLMNMPSPMPTREQIFFLDIRLGLRLGSLSAWGESGFPSCPACPWC